MADQLTPQEQNLIARLQNAPQPELRPDAFEAIRARMLDAMNLPPAPAPAPGLTLSLPIIVIIVVVIGIIGVIIGIGIGSQPPPTPTPIPSVTLPAEIATEEITPEITPSLTATPEPTAEATPEITPEATTEAIIIIEGPVDEIRDNVIVVYGIEIIVNPTDPVLAIIKIGDLVHVEGRPGDNPTIIIAIIVIIINVDEPPNNVNVNPNTGETWTDDGSCSNPPPDWAPANGWRRRCGQGGGNSNNPGGNNPGQGNGNGNGNGRGNSDDDD